MFSDISVKKSFQLMKSILMRKLTKIMTVRYDMLIKIQSFKPSFNCKGC